MGLVLLIVLLVLIFGAYPRWGYNRDWGYAPFGGLLGIVLLIILVLWLTGHLGSLRL